MKVDIRTRLLYRKIECVLDVYGNFEDLETGETHEDTETAENGETKRIAKKKKLKEKFDAE